MVRGRALLLLLPVLGGCGDDVPAWSEPEPGPPPVFAEVCGTEGPHRLLALGPGEHAYGVTRLSPAVEGQGGAGDAGPDGRVLISTFFVEPGVPLAAAPTLDTAIHAVGPCGEDPVELARGLQRTPGPDPLLLACHRDGHGIWVLDPEGVAAPRPILDGSCPVRSTDAGLVTVQAEPDQRHGDLVLLREPAAPGAEPEVLASGIRTGHNAYFGPGSGATTSLWAAGSEVVGLDEAGVVHSLDLVTGERTEELTGVRELRISGDGRFMVWQALEPAEGEPQTPVSPVFLRDRQAHTDAYLLGTHLEWTGSPYAGDYLVIRDDVQGLRVFRRPGGERIALPEGTDVRGVLDGGALWLVRRVDGITEELRWLPPGEEPGEQPDDGPGEDSGEAPVVFARHQGQVRRRADGVEIFEPDLAVAPNEGPLSFVPWEGGEPVRLADRVHASRGRLADGRILTIVYEDDTGHGALRLIDPEADAFVQLDARGFVQSPRLDQGDPFEGDVVYAVAEGERERGVYRARVPR